MKELIRPLPPNKVREFNYKTCYYVPFTQLIVEIPNIAPPTAEPKNPLIIFEIPKAKNCRFKSPVVLVKSLTTSLVMMVSIRLIAAMENDIFITLAAASGSLLMIYIKI